MVQNQMQTRCRCILRPCTPTRRSLLRPWSYSSTTFSNYMGILPSVVSSGAPGPHLEIFSYQSKEATDRGIAAQVAASFFKLSPKDNHGRADERAYADEPTKRWRYTEVVEFAWLHVPLLRRITRTTTTESHLNETTSMPEFLAALPGDVTLTQAYDTRSMTPSQILWYVQVYTGQLESMGRWRLRYSASESRSSPHKPQPMVSIVPPSLVPRDCQWQITNNIQ
jgi:hypothetical protein